MKKTIYLFILSVGLIYACHKGEESIPGDEDYKNHPILWNSAIPHHSEFNKTKPLILDEDDNIYLLCYNDDYYSANHSSRIISYDVNGAKRWERDFEGETATVIYYSGQKLFVGASEIVEQENTSTVVYFMDAQTGEILHTHDLYEEYSFYRIKGIAGTEDRIYVRSSVEYQKDYIIAYDFEGEEKWKAVVGLDIYDFNIIDDHLYLRSADNYRAYLISEDGLSFLWQKDISGRCRFDKDGNLFVLDDTTMYKISKNGQVLKTIQMKEEWIGSGWFYRIPDGFLIPNYYLYKVDEDGTLVWKAGVDDEISHSSILKIAIAKNGYVYSSNRLGLFAISPEGKLAWHIGVYQWIIDFSVPKLNSKGDLICISPQHNLIYCIKGDGSPPL